MKNKKLIKDIAYWLILLALLMLKIAEIMSKTF